MRLAEKELKWREGLKVGDSAMVTAHAPWAKDVKCTITKITPAQIEAQCLYGRIRFWKRNANEVGDRFGHMIFRAFKKGE